MEAEFEDEQDSIVRCEVLECHEISAFKIPPGNISIRDWQKYDSKPIWTGSLKLTEEECFSGRTEAMKSGVPVPPIDRIRLKLELFNEVQTFQGKINQLWAVVWYNPIHTLDSLPENAITKRETIERTDSYRHFKLIAQVPESGYSGLHFDDDIIQVALGLKFDDKIDAYTFSERIDSYKKQFQSIVDQYKFELDLISLSDRQASLRLSDSISSYDTNNHDDSDDDDDDDFGDFVS